MRFFSFGSMCCVRVRVCPMYLCYFVNMWFVFILFGASECVVRVVCEGCVFV